MTISDGYRIHEGRYRMPDLLSEVEMKMYFASTYGIGIDLRELTDEEREKINSVGTVPMTPVIGDREREISLLRKQLGINDLEKRLPPREEPPSSTPSSELDDLLK